MNVGINHHTTSYLFKIRIDYKQWIKTAENDLMVAKLLLKIFVKEPTLVHMEFNHSPPYNWICLIFFDCIEKALKAALFANDLRSLNDKDLLKTQNLKS